MSLKIIQKVKELSLNEKALIISQYDSFVEEGALSNCLLRELASEWSKEVNSSFNLLYVQQIVFILSMELAKKYIEKINVI